LVSITPSSTPLQIPARPLVPRVRLPQKSDGVEAPPVRREGAVPPRAEPRAVGEEVPGRSAPAPRLVVDGGLEDDDAFESCLETSRGSGVAQNPDPYLSKVLANGGFAAYRRRHLDTLALMFTAPPVQNDGRRRSRRRVTNRLGSLERLPPEIIRRVVEFWAHVGHY
jgi:hypothetical protein